MGAQSPGFFSNQIVNTLGKRDRRHQQQMKGRITLFLKPGFLTTREWKPLPTLTPNVISMSMQVI